ncbi:MAG: hypothetical protein LBE44_06805 [Microbacterium hominis]|jgi:hypothetical protein|uniref:hypothetical protein n=1 Tax=Microbacterium aurum TaxID=36805 RepID=UPI00248E7EFE|nr:hypothetical protein [Microbacterium aurum]MBZ6371597.1 hypothetical protein [Microbacterium hominis]
MTDADEKVYTVGVIVGSVSEPSLNRRFADALIALGPDAGLEFSALGAPLVGVPEAYIRVGDEFFDGDGGFANAGTREFLTGFLRQLHDLIGRWAPGAS